MRETDHFWKNCMPAYLIAKITIGNYCDLYTGSSFYSWPKRARASPYSRAHQLCSRALSTVLFNSTLTDARSEPQRHTTWRSLAGVARGNSGIVVGPRGPGTGTAGTWLTALEHQ